MALLICPHCPCPHCRASRKQSEGEATGSACAGAWARLWELRPGFRAAGGSGCQFCQPACPQGDAFSKVTLLHGWIEDSKYWPDGRKSYVTHKEEMILLFSRGETLYSRGLKELSREAAAGPATCDSGLSADFSELVAAASLEQSRGERCLAPAWGGGGDALGPARRDSAGLPAPGAQARDSQFPGAASHVLPRSFWRVVI